MTLSRDFKGIWIPKEIWLHPELKSQEKALWAEINSLYSEEHNGCYASEEYLMEFIGVKVSRLREILAKLKELCLLIDVHFDGRKKIRMAILPSIETSGKVEGRPPEQSETSGKVEGRDPENRRSHPIYKNKAKAKEIKKNKQKKSYRDLVALTEEEYAKIQEVYGNNTGQALDLLDNYKFTHGKKYENDYGVFKKGGWIYKKFFEDQKGSSSEANKDYAVKVAQKFAPQGIEAFNEFIEFGKGQFAKSISYKENGFRSQVESQLRKMNLPIDGL